MTWGTARRMSTGGAVVAGRGVTGSQGAAGEGLGFAAKFAAKMVGIGLCAGLGLVSCQLAIEACFRVLR